MMGYDPLNKNRIVAIDILRGFCIFTMVAQFWFMGFESTFESWALIFEHDEDGLQILRGVSFADIFAPMFIFIIGLTINRSFKSKEERFGSEKATGMMVERYLGIAGVGAVLTGLDKFVSSLGKMADSGEKSTEAFMKIVNKQGLNVKVVIICFFIAVLLLIVSFLLRLAKSEKVDSLASGVMRLYLAAVGLFIVYSIFAYTGESIFKSFTGEKPAWSIGTKLWDTLENIGLAGLIALPFVKTSKRSRITAVCFIYIAWSALCNHSNMELVSQVLEGGAVASPCWASILILGSVFSDLYSERDNKKYWLLVVALLAFALIGVYGFNFPAAKRGCSPVYAAFTSAIAAAVFRLFTLFGEDNPVSRFFRMWGGNALVLYILNFSLSLIAGAVIEACGFEPSKLAGCLFVVLVMVVFSVIILPLQKKEKHVRM